MPADRSLDKASCKVGRRCVIVAGTKIMLATMPPLYNWIWIITAPPFKFYYATISVKRDRNKGGGRRIKGREDCLLPGAPLVNKQFSQTGIRTDWLAVSLIILFSLPSKTHSLIRLLSNQLWKLSSLKSLDLYLPKRPRFVLPCWWNSHPQLNSFPLKTNLSLKSI